jgi:hypothetical protein
MKPLLRNLLMLLMTTLPMAAQSGGTIGWNRTTSNTAPFLNLSAARVVAAHVATPSAPPAGYVYIYAKSDGKIYTLDENSTETDISTGAAPGSGDDVFINGANVTHPDFDDATYIKYVVTGTNVTAYATNLVSNQITDGTLTADDLGADSVSASELNATGVESELEAILDLPDLQGTVGTAQIADNAVTGAKIALASQAAGDIMYYNGTDWIVLPKGTAGQVLEMNAGATAPEWDTDDNSGSNTTFDALGDTAADGSVSLGHTNIWTFTLDGSKALYLLASDADNAADTTLLRLGFNDSADANSIFLEMVDDEDGTPRTVYSFSATAFTSAVAGSFGTGNGQIDVGTAGVRITGDGDGAITFLGLGDGSDEDFTLNLDDTANTIVASSSTGVTLLDLGAIGLDLDSSSLKLPTGNDPDLATEGLISYDANGDVLRGYDGTRQVALAQAIEALHVTVITPQDLADAQRDAFLFWSNESGMSFVVTGWKGWAGTDDTTLNIETTLADGTSNTVVDAVELATGTGPYTGSDTTISSATIANGSLLWLDFDDTDTPTYVKITIYGYYAADVN